jgi:hypothetical protein
MGKSPAQPLSNWRIVWFGYTAYLVICRDGNPFGGLSPEIGVCRFRFLDALSQIGLVPAKLFNSSHPALSRRIARI